MSTLDRGPGPRTCVESGGLCLVMILVNLVAFPVPGIGQSNSSRTGDRSSADPKLTGPNRREPGSGRSIELYRAHCINCHEEDGRGVASREIMGRIPDFTRTEWPGERDDERLLHVIRDGKGSMPAMKAKLGPNDAVLLVTLVRKFRGGRQVIPEGPVEPVESSRSPSPERLRESTKPRERSPGTLSRSTSEPAVPRAEPGRGVFQRLCVACHGADGRANAMRASMPWLPDFAAPEWHSRRDDAQLAISILEGKGTSMPAFVGKLGEDQARRGGRLCPVVRVAEGSADPQAVKRVPPPFRGIA